jgi:hypothetical protein
MQESYRRRADHIGVKLEAVGCTVARLTNWEAESFRFEAGEIETMARMEQERRIDERLREDRTGPEPVTWDQLAEPERQSFMDAAEDLPMFLAQAGFQVRRL